MPEQPWFPRARYSLAHWSYLASLGSVVAACSSDSGNDTDPQREQITEEVTYYQDVLPIFEQACLQCHQAQSIGPFRLDQYQEAAKWAPQIAAATRAGIMPPWYATHDGSCGEFTNTLELTSEQVETLEAWHEQGALEGTRGDREIQLAELPRIKDPAVYKTPLIAPEIQGGELAEFDEYRCFPLDSELDEPRFITAYDVRPGNTSLVHHVIAYVVDRTSPSLMDGLSNAEVMDALDSESPDRPGWPCYADAGEGILANAGAATWAPGQGMVRFPGDSGVLLLPSQVLVIQMHYNLVDPEVRGQEDQTSLELELTDIVPNVGTVIADDALLGSLDTAEPITLPPGEAKVTKTWSRKFAELVGPNTPSLKVWGFMPHMHELGSSYRLTVHTNDSASCGIDLKYWDFNWQHMYFLETPFEVDADSSIEVECTYDTRPASSTVLPGWGTRNEMCTGVMYITVPLLR